jgi:hypothetical protein
VTVVLEQYFLLISQAVSKEGTCALADIAALTQAAAELSISSSVMSWSVNPFQERFKFEGWNIR